MGKESFILYLEQQEVFEMLSDEEAGKLIKAIFEYEKTGKIINLDKALQIAFIPIKSSLDRNKEKYNKVVERNKKNIEKRWKKENTKNTTGKSGMNINTKNTDNDNDSDNVNDNDNEYDNDSDNVNDSCVDGLQEIIDFYNNNIGMITPYALETLAEYGKKIGKDLVILAMKKSVEGNARNINYIKSILNNWDKKGIKTLIEAEEESIKFNKNKSTSGKFEQREYSDTEINSLYANFKGE